jgi:hypothetical protein
MKMKKISLILTAALCLSGLSAKAEDSLTLDKFAYTNKLMVAGYTGTETLQNFPVLVRLSETRIPGFSYGNLTNNKGADIAFFDANGTHLASEIETNCWTTSGESLIWVKLPQMTQGTRFFMCYNTTASGAWVTNENPWGDYVGVWHLDEEGGSGKTIYDSTTNCMNGLSYAGNRNGSDKGGGAVGHARRIAEDYTHAYGIVVDATNGIPQKAAADRLDTDFHASFWMLSQAGTDYANKLRWGNILGRRKGDQGFSWGFQFGGDTSGKTTVDYMRVHYDNDNSGNMHTKEPIGAWLKLDDGVWKKVDIVWKYKTNGDNSIGVVYTNGVYADTVAFTKPVCLQDANIGIGCSTQDNPANATGRKGRRFNGSMDEVRLRPGVSHLLLSEGNRESDWIKADFDTVNNEQFVTIAPPDVLEVTWAESAEMTGVTNVTWSGAVVGGTVTSLDENATGCTIEGKFWIDGDSEPVEWMTLTNGLAKLDAFEVVVSCQANTTYNYKLRAVDDNGETEPVMGTFTTPAGLAVTWAVTSRTGVTNVLSHIAVIGGTIDALDSASSITIEGKFWNGDETEPAEWTALGEPLSQAGDFSLSISGLEIDHLYTYKLQAKGSNGIVVSPASGTFMTGHGLAIHWSGSAEQPGVTNVAWNSVIVGGAVEGTGDEPSCSLEGKFWVDGTDEPTEWQMLGAGDFELGDFSVSVPDLVENTTYNYKLRATGDNSATPVATGTFTTPVGLAATWAEAAGVTNALCYSAVIGGVIDCLGNSETCTIHGKFWVGESEPTEWTALGETLSQTGDFSIVVSNLTAGTTYNYKLRVLGANGVATNPISDSFTTLQGLTINWAVDSGTTGFSRIVYDFVVVGGAVQNLGEATSCTIQYKVWSGDEPDGWETLASGLGLSQTFDTAVNGFAAGTTYSYKLRALGNDGMPSETISGTFKTKGEEGEVIGSDNTEFFDDGTNACWIVKGFERYLPFTVTGYTGTETLTNFPVLVEIRKKDTNGFKYEDFYHTDGSDMAFVDEKGHIIPHEIDTWNKTGMSLIWVRLPEMVNGTKFTMCYRSPLLEPLPDVGNTFEKYVGVWHMNETQDGVVAVEDSTANNLPGESHAKSTAYSSGRIGYARRVAYETGTSSSNGRIMVYDHDDILRTSVGNVFTFSGWYKVANTTPNWAYLVARKGDDYSRGWGIQFTDSNASDKLRVWSDPLGEKTRHGSVSNDKVTLGGYYEFGISRYHTDVSTGYKHTDWTYWTFVFSNDTFHAYHNGTELNSTKAGYILEQPFANDASADFDYLVIGGQEFGTGALNGWVDEARYSKGPRSDDWIKAEYVSTMQAQWWNEPTKRFVTKGTVSSGHDSPVPVVVWEKGANLPVSIVDVSYAYVQFAGMVTYCGAGSDNCRIEYQVWADGEEDPAVAGVWTPLGNLTNVEAGTSFSIPVTGLKQDMPYNFRIRAVNTMAGGVEQANREQTGSFRTNGNVSGSGEGELLRIDNRFVHRYRAGSYTFTTPDYVTSVEIMVVGGGGAGGYKIGGGGGGGGLFYSESFPVETNTTYRIQVGEGGNAASSLDVRGGNGEISYFARKDGDGEEDETILISVPGGGAGGSPAFTTVGKVQVAVTNIAAGADGGSGGGGSFALEGGQPVSNEVDGVWVTYGYQGGQGNDNRTGGNQQGKTAAGGGGGAGREGVTASFDGWYGGGAGGAGLANSMTGEQLFYGAGGGGGYAYRTDDKGNYSKPGAGGSGIGGNAADVRNGTPATSGVENTGAGGGGGSMILGNDTDQTYWQGGDGGDGVVLIAYEVHGRDPLAEDPRISMSRCDYNPDAGETGTGVATIDFRAFWAGIQAQENDIYVLYSTVSEEDVAAGNGERTKVSDGSIGIGTTEFVPPEVGYTYWVRLMARKDESSFMYSDEVASFYVPAVTLKGATWNDDGSAKVLYKLHDLTPETHLYCYWSESRNLLEGDTTPTGDGVHYLDLGTGKAESTEFNIPASEGLDKSKVYYIRLVSGDAGGWKRFLSDEIAELKYEPSVILSAALWNSQTATVEYTMNTRALDPADAELIAYYSIIEKEVKDPQLAKVTQVNLGSCAALPNGVVSTNSFPLFSDVATNYYVRLAIHSLSDNTWYHSSAYKSVSTSAATANTLYIFATANAKKGAYGDAPQMLDYEVSYGGLTNGVGFTYFTNNVSITGDMFCGVNSTTGAGIYDITQGTLALVGPGSYHVDEEVDPDTDDVISEEADYFCALAFVGAKYTVTNAVFSVSISDIVTNYTGEAIETGGINPVVTGIRNDQPVTFLYRVGDGEWSDTISTSYSETWTHTVQFKATAENHELAVGTFMITINPAPLYAEISALDWSYTGVAQSPMITTNVTGHIKPDLNPLTCEFRDEAGAWTNAVPSFTQPGTYKLFFRVSAPNHATFTTNCTFTISGWDYKVNMDGEAGYKTEINVSDPGWLLRTTGEGSEHFADRDQRYENLDRVCLNGLKLWQNYVIDRQDLSKKLVATIMQRGSRVNKDSFVVHFPNVEALRNTGLNIRFRLDKKLKGEGTFTQGALSDKYDMNVPLGFEDGNDSTGLYVFNMVLVSTNETAETGAGEAVLASCATVGVMRVSSTNANTVTAVPWHSMSIANETPTNIVANEVVNQNGLSMGDMILGYKAVAGKFNAWKNEGEDGWKALATVSTNGVEIIAADDAQFPCGNAFWLVRSNPSARYFYLIGRYTGDDYEVSLAGGTAESPGHTLVANPMTDDVTLGALKFYDGSGVETTPDNGDRIVILNEDGFETAHYRSGEKWVHRELQVNGRRTKQVEVDSSSVVIPPGRGFWYSHPTDTTLMIKFGGAK